MINDIKKWIQEEFHLELNEILKGNLDNKSEDQISAIKI